jgi:hypothetical protein
VRRVLRSLLRLRARLGHPLKAVWMRLEKFRVPLNIHARRTCPSSAADEEVEGKDDIDAEYIGESATTADKDAFCILDTTRSRMA